eukprot:893829-Prymnesium_polylepis.1
MFGRSCTEAEVPHTVAAFGSTHHTHGACTNRGARSKPAHAGATHGAAPQRRNSGCNQMYCWRETVIGVTCAAGAILTPTKSTGASAECASRCEQI